PLARARMLRQEQAEEHPPLPLDPLAAGLDDHAGFALANARRRQDTTAQVHDAQPAHADRALAGMMAQDRDRNALLPGGLPQGRAWLHRDGAAVQGELNHADIVSAEKK